jgi:hypothetical protein
MSCSLVQGSPYALCLNACGFTLYNSTNFHYYLYTVKKTVRDAGPQHEGDGKLRHPHRPSGLMIDGGFFRLFYADDVIFSVTHMLWACVTLGFCNSDIG